MIPDDVEKIVMTKEDYDRNVEQLLVDKCEAELEIERLHSIIKEVRDKTIRMIADSSLDYMYKQAYRDILKMIDTEIMK